MNLVESMKNPGSALNDLIVFFNEQNDERLWFVLNTVARTLDHKGLTVELLLGVIIEVINYLSYQTYYVFVISRPRIVDWLDSFNQYFVD